MLKINLPVFLTLQFKETGTQMTRVPLGQQLEARKITQKLLVMVLETYI